jgi:hypothetical protein
MYNNGALGTPESKDVTPFFSAIDKVMTLVYKEMTLKEFSQVRSLISEVERFLADILIEKSLCTKDFFYKNCSPTDASQVIIQSKCGIYIILCLFPEHID